VFLQNGQCMEVLLPVVGRSGWTAGWG
jgi:hypothetical protein